nr:LamG domain-containing protein [Pirellulales bacterium]
LEGIAEFRIGLDSSDVRLQLEGPASVVLTGQGAISLRYGKIIVTTGDLGERYPIETSFGRVLIEPNAQTGLVSFGSTEEIHSFIGEAKVESPWLTSSDLEGGAVVKAGEALHFKEMKDGVLTATHGAVQRGRFTLQVPMTHDFLAVGPEYVREITDSHPVAYWRFEGAHDGVVRNEVAERYHGRLKGQVGWVGPEGNQAIEFGITPEPGSLVVAESWGDLLGGDFSLEAWIKPSHYHLGSILGFIGEFDWQDRRNKHGLLLEVNGTSQPGNLHQPQRLRLLHRPVLGVTGGVSLYSDRSYQPRRWQHVAAVRDGEELRLYLDGHLVQQATSAEPLPHGLQLVVGQLYTETVERFFIGHVDEIAIYDRPLSEKEIRRRHELLRPSGRDDDHVL